MTNSLNSRRFIIYSLCLFAMMLALFVAVTPDAQAFIKSTGGGGGAGGTGITQLNAVCGVNMFGTATSGTTAPGGGMGELKIFSVGVACFESIVNGLAEETIIKLSTFLQSTIYAMLVIYLILFGGKAILGINAGEKLKSEFFIHILKIAFVAWLIFNFGMVEIYRLTLQAYYSMLEVVLSDATTGGSASTGGCGMSAYSSGGTEQVWKTMDCMFAQFIGWESKNGYGTQWKGTAMLFAIISSMIMPANGFIVGGVLASAMWALIMGFFRLAFVYILSMVALIILFAVSPIFVPMMLFTQTKSYFEGWYRMVISMIMQPVILFAFFSFVSGLLYQIIEDMKDLYESVMPKYEISQVNELGTARSFDQVKTVVSDMVKNMDAELLVNAISVLAVAWLMISFIGFVAKMAVELAGQASAPNLGDYAPNFQLPKRAR